MSSIRLRRWLLVFVIITGALTTACDPLAPDPTSIALVSTPTPAPTAFPTPTPTATATPTATPTPLPPTATPIPTATPWICTETEGQIVDITFPSNVARADARYLAYLPPCYVESGRRFPYVILMHGLGQDQSLWVDQLDIVDAIESGLALRALAPMIVIMPRGGELEANNDFREGRSWASLILDELIPQVEATFCTWENREGRAIGGISRGGFWAYSIGLRFPDRFSAVGGHSAAFYADNPPAHNPLNLARTAEFPPGMQPRFWLDIGGEDAARVNVQAVYDRLQSRDIEVSFIVNPEGDHTAAYWAAHLTEYLTFYGQDWPRGIRDLPSCQ